MISVTTEDWARIQETLKSAANMTQTVDKLAAGIAEIMNMKEELAQAIDQCNQMTSSDPATPSSSLDMKLYTLESDLKWMQEQLEMILSR